MTTHTANIDGRTFAVASDTTCSLSSVVYKSRLESESTTLAEIQLRDGEWQRPVAIRECAMDANRKRVVPGENIALSYGVASSCDGSERFLFFVDEDAANGYVYARRCSPEGQWEEPVNTGFKAHRFSKFSATIHNENGSAVVLLYCTTENDQLMEICGTPNSEDGMYEWEQSTSSLRCAPRGDVAVVPGRSEIYILFRNRDLDLCLTRRTREPNGGEPKWEKQSNVTRVKRSAALRKDSPAAVNEDKTKVKRSGGLRKNSPVAIALHTNGEEECYLTAFFVVLYGRTPMICAKDIQLDGSKFNVQSTVTIGTLETSSNLGATTGNGPHAIHLLSVSELDGSDILLDRIQSNRTTSELSQWVIAGGIVDTDIIASN